MIFITAASLPVRFVLTLLLLMLSQYLYSYWLAAAIIVNLRFLSAPS